MAQETTPQRDNTLLKALLWTGAVLGTAALVNATIAYRTPPVTNQLPGGSSHWLPLAEGDIYYKKAGDGPPVLLVHGIGAGCSSLEWHAIFAALAQTHTVYALDLLGFGRSDKPRVAYSPELYRDILADFCDQVIGEPTDVIASSLSTAFVVTLAAQRPERFGKLVLVCPTGLQSLCAPLKPEGKVLQLLFQLPIVGTSLYNAITSRVAMQQYLEQRIFSDPTLVDPDLIAQFHTAAHQPGADRVLPYFVSGYLNCPVEAALRALPEAPHLIWGENAVETPLAHADAFRQVRPDSPLALVEDAGNLPHAERPAAFLALVRPWLS